MKMKYLITGATGHLGRYVIQELSKLTSTNNIRLGVHTPAKAIDLKLLAMRSHQMTTKIPR